jgi:2-polyprenyl-3-methyl-5-hydroxy-6-metoxy-1,4-benzoquinol methylase
MKLADRILQRWRIRKIRPCLKPGARVLDIGSADGVLFSQIPQLAKNCLGIDPTLPKKIETEKFILLPGFFPKDMPAVEPFDAITLLAVLEHFPPAEFSNVAAGCAKFLAPGGLLLITVPSPAVDKILAALKFLRLIEGMSLEEHHGYEVAQTTQIFSDPPFELVRRAPFQLGLNNLFVFRRRADKETG